MERSYHILGRSDSRSSRKLAAYLARHGQFLLPWVELIEQSRLAVDELIDVVGRAAIEAVLELSAAQVAGPRRQGRRRRGVGWYGRQRGTGAPEGEKAGRAQATAPAARPGSGERSSPPGLRSHAGGRGSGGPDVGYLAAGRLDPAVPAGVAGDGGHRGCVALHGQPGNDGGCRSRVRTSVEPPLRGSRVADPLHRRDGVWRPSRDCGCGRGCGRAQARAGDSAGGYGERRRPSRTCWKV